MRAVALLLVFISSAFAYRVLTPGDKQGWTNVGAQPLSWDRVESDNLNFTAVLDNQSLSGFSRQVLAALVDGRSGNASMNPPSGGWPTGTRFRVNFVQDDNNLDHILAQSVEFSILPPNTTTSRTTPLSTAISSTNTVIDNASPSDTGVVVPAAASGALAAYSAKAGLISFLSLLAYALA